MGNNTDGSTNSDMYNNQGSISTSLSASSASSASSTATAIITSRVIKYSRDNIDTDVIIPGQYLKIHDYAELAKHAMEGLDEEFHAKSKDASLVMAGRNFGCGSSREHAPIALSHSGIKAVVALSFARIFYRNAVDGAFLLPIEIGQDAYDGTSHNDVITIDVASGVLRNETTGQTYRIKPFSEIISKIIEAGGLFKYGMQYRQNQQRQNGQQEA